MLRVRIFGKENPYIRWNNNKCSFSNYYSNISKGEHSRIFRHQQPLYRRLIIVFERNPVQYFPVNYLATSEYASSRKRSRLRIADETAKGETRLSGQWRFRAGHRSKGNVFRPLFSPPWLCKDRQAVIALKDWNVRPLSPRPLSS